MLLLAWIRVRAIVRVFLVGASLGLLSAGASETPPINSDVAIVLGPAASDLERNVARELRDALAHLYPRNRFTIGGAADHAARLIRLGTPDNDPAIAALVDEAQLATPESFVIAHGNEQSRPVAAIAGADARGVVQGVYGLLRHLGCGFYLTGDVMPPPRAEPLSFDDWAWRDEPLVRERLVFNWHNFLSGCTSWNFSDWQHWADQSRKMGFNTLMVHAYGNNPMFTFRFNGREKPVGYIATTQRGRDWSTMHVNDVRRLHGGFVFDEAVFGAEAAQVPDAARASAAQALMQRVFSHAADRGMDVHFALDVDTVSANPQELILTLPPAARFAVKNPSAGSAGAPFWLADPDTAEGYRYYRAQAAALLTAYPQLTSVVAWFRIEKTPWMEFELHELPAAWQEEFHAEIARTPAAADLWHARHMFAIGKIIRAWQRALRDLGHAHVQVAAGSWLFDFVAPGDRFFPPDVKLIGLDWSVLWGESRLRDAAARATLREVGARRSVVPVIWAHHDDGNYVGRPYTPFSEFASRLGDARASGYGIIHWTTRPLDLYFTSHARQVWRATRDEPLETTTAVVAKNWLGSASDPAPLADYLQRWLLEAPKFGRETGDAFIAQQLTEIDAELAASAARRKLLATIDRAGLDAAGRARLDYLDGYEEFIAEIFRAQDAYQRSRALLQAGDLTAARAAFASCTPEAVVERFARISSLGGITRGEQGLVATMNTRWLAHFRRHRQELGLAPMRLNFAPTAHEPLAQHPGHFTFHVDPDGHTWECAGEEETGLAVFTAADESEEIRRHGISSATPIALVLRPGPTTTTEREKNQLPVFPAGAYTVQLLFPRPRPADARERELAISLGQSADTLRESARPSQPDTNVNASTHAITLDAPGPIHLTVTPAKGEAALCGVIVTPRGAD